MMRRSAAPWPSASTRASSTGTEPSSEPCTTISARSRERLGAAHGGRTRRSSAAQLSRSRGKPGRADHARPRGRTRAAGGGARPSRRSRPGRPAWPRLGTRGSARGGAQRQRPAGPEAGQPHAVDRGQGGERVHRRGHVVEPPAEREVTRGLAAAPEGEAEPRPSPFEARDPLGQGGQGGLGVGGGAAHEGEAVAEHQRGPRPQRAPRLREVAGQGRSVRADPDRPERHGQPVSRSPCPAAGATGGSRGCAPRPTCRARSRGTAPRPAARAITGASASSSASTS